MAAALVAASGVALAKEFVGTERGEKIVVLVVGVITVALNAVIYFGYQVSGTPLVGIMFSVGASLPEGIGKPVPKASSSSRPAGKSNAKSGGKSGPDSGFQ